MKLSRLMATSLLATCAAASAADKATPATGDVTSPRLYAMPCGTVAFKDFGFFSDTGEYDGQPRTVGVSCYLIRHPKGDLLWDAGLDDAVAKNAGGMEVAGGAMRMEVKTPLLPQLAKIGVTPDDVEFVAFSHLHFDHTGNANAFPKATWLMNAGEIAWALGQPTPFGVDPTHFSAFSEAKSQVLSGDHDVFGDGSVRILRAPGHTPGHQVLMLNLAQAGTVVLSGDLYHTRENAKHHRVPAFNHNRADTLASMDRVDRLVRNHKALFIIQHSDEDVAKLPKFPAYLE